MLKLTKLPKKHAKVEFTDKADISIANSNSTFKVLNLRSRADSKAWQRLKNLVFIS